MFMDRTLKINSEFAICVIMGVSGSLHFKLKSIFWLFK